MLMDLFFQSLPVRYKTRFHYHHFLLSLYKKIHDALEKHRLQLDEEERLANELAEKGDAKGYSWSRREEMKALALTKGWRSVFGGPSFIVRSFWQTLMLAMTGGRAANDPELNTREFVLANIARDLIKEQGWLLAFDEVQLIDIAGAGLVSRVLSWYWRLGGVVVGTSNRVPQGNSGYSQVDYSRAKACGQICTTRAYNARPLPPSSTHLPLARQSSRFTRRSIIDERSCACRNRLMPCRPATLV